MTFYRGREEINDAFAKMICISIAIKKYIYMLACLLNLLAMASVNVCRLCTNVEKNNQSFQ